VRMGKYVWWCGGFASEGKGPSYRVTDNGPLWEDSETQSKEHDFEVVEVCGSCQRVSPFQNGCRWVGPEDFAFKMLLIEGGEKDEANK